jgi:hypothetical protein
LREAGRLRVFECRVLRKVFGPKTDEVAGEWRRLGNEELIEVYSPNSVWVIK